MTNLKNLLRRFALSTVAACFLPLAPIAFAAPKPPAPLVLIHRFELPGYVTGRFDHFGVDLAGNRLFLAAESMHQVLVLNLKTGTVIHRMSDIEIPHAIVYRETVNRIYVTDGGAAALKVFDGKNYRLVKSIQLQLDADSVAYDQTMRYLYIVNGGEDAHQPTSLVSVIDTNTDTKVGEVTIDSPHVEAMAVDTTSSRLYVNNTGKNKLDVVDREKYRFMTSWPVTLCKQNVPAALDEANNRLFIGCRSGQISVFDTQTGKEIQGLTIGKGIDDLTFDPRNKRIYASCGTDGRVYVFQQKSADNYEPLGSVASGPGARNSRYIPGLHELLVSVPAHQGAAAEVLVYRDR
ncbi:MAG TPA: YncE family protein [Candidatus Acidoferrales bacterium]|nr:YncE family protein [Candidatus Acidoferrales bacterium]